VYAHLVVATSLSLRELSRCRGAARYGLRPVARPIAAQRSSTAQLDVLSFSSLSAFHLTIYSPLLLSLVNQHTGRRQPPEPPVLVRTPVSLSLSVESPPYPARPLCLPLPSSALVLALLWLWAFRHVLHLQKPALSFVERFAALGFALAACTLHNDMLTNVVGYVL
jgi:hypothetical protein